MDKKTTIGLGVLGLALLAPPLASAQAKSSTALVRHGKYLVERVGMCADCHTPHLPNGAPDRSRWLQGSVVGFKPLHPMPWEKRAPRIAGLPHHWTAAQTKHYLMTGVRPDGHRSDPPMPEIRLSGHDADAVVAYLESLKK